MESRPTVPTSPAPQDHGHHHAELQERYSLAMQAASMGTWDWDVLNDTLLWSEQCSHIMGCEHKGSNNLATFVQCLHPDDAEMVMDCMDVARETHGLYNPEYRIIRPRDGQEAWVHCTGRFHYDESGKPYRMIGVITDITQKKAMERALRENEARFRQMADMLPQMVWVVRPDGYHEYYNQRWYDFTGLAEGESNGMYWDGIFHPEDQRISSKVWFNCLKTGEPYEHEYRLRDASGQYRWALGRAVPLRDEQGTILKWFGTCTIIEDQKRAEAELREARDAAEAANIAKTEFLANMSHEIRTPMNAIIGLANLLERSQLNDKQRRFVTTLQGSANALLTLINDLLDISKVEAGGIEVEEVYFSLPDLLEEVARMMDVRVREKDLSITYSIAADVADTVRGDAARIRQILLNLCSNAVKFTERGGISIEVTDAGMHHDKRQFAITVSDTGIGIPAEKLDTIFDKFVQADASINRKYGGTGLGLAITKQLSEALGGTIHVESTPGVGSRFIVTLPLTPDRRATQRQETSQPLFESTQSAHEPRILLIEDHPANVLVASTILTQLGYAHDVACNADEAIMRWQNHPYDLLLMDVQMPGKDGLEATRIIRSMEREQKRMRTPVVGMTAHALTGDRNRCLDAGMDEYLSKPFHPEELQNLLATVLRRESMAA